MGLDRMSELLARCPRCGVTVLLTYGRVSYRNLAVFEPTPWSPLDEPEPPGERFTEAGRRRWLALLPFKLYVCYIDFEQGTWEVALPRASDRLREGVPLWKPHNCLEESDDALYGPNVEPRKEDLVPDRAAVAVAPRRGDEPGHVAGDGVRGGGARPVRRRRGGL